MTPARKVITFPKALAPRREYELAFLPAALEITETPASPIGRAIGLTIIVVFCAALIWACLGSVDITATAVGKIVPTGRSKLIQPLEIGVVRSINVHDGQIVRAGDALVELDPTMINAEEGHLKSDRIAAELDVARLHAALSGGADPLANFVAPVGASHPQIEMHRQFLASLVAELNAKVAEVDRQLQQKEAERASVVATIAKLETTTPVLQERVDVRKGLSDKGLGSRLTYLTEYQDLVSMQQDLLVQRSHLHEAEAASAALKESRERTVAEYRRALFDDLAKAEQKVAALEQDVVKAERRSKFQLLTAPVDGIVQQLAVHTVGGVVTPAQVLAVLVPLDSNLEIEARVSNRDIGFVHTGQEVEIKVDTFSFTRYGLLHGQVINVSQDAVTVDKAQDKANESAPGSVGNSSEPRGQELNYIARVSLDRTQMQVESGPVSLGPGMAVTIEIKTGSRRIIDYLLSPLVKYKNEALHER
jgi:hemolysin D